MDTRGPVLTDPAETYHCEQVANRPHLYKVITGDRGYICVTDEFGGVPYRVGVVNLRHERNVKIQCAGSTTSVSASIIECAADATALQRSWFESCILKYLKSPPKSGSVLNEIFNGLASVFNSKGPLSTEKLIGLWGELYAIFISQDHSVMAGCWVDKTHDFVSPADLLEVKTTLGDFLLPHFSLQQLNPSLACGIVCMQVKNGPPGLSIRELELEISKSLSPEALENFKDRIMKRLEGDFDAAQQLYEVSGDNLRLFDATTIPKPELIPAEVRNLRFQVCLQTHKDWKSGGSTAPSGGLIEKVLDRRLSF